MNGKQKLTATVICQDEAENIGRCLKSLSSVADEIVVLDSGSTDSTEQICRSFPIVQFVQQPWLGYSKQKQKAVDLATNDLILSLDADESLSKELQNTLSQLKVGGIPEGHAYELKRRTNYCGRWIRFCGWYPDPQLRLFHRHEAHWLDVPVHEHVVCNADVKVRRLHGDLLHYSYQNITEHHERLLRYAQLGAQKLHSRSIWFLTLQSYTNAISRFLKVYIFRLGFLDGYYGLVIAYMAGYAAHLKYRLAAAQNRGPKKINF